MSGFAACSITLHDLREKFKTPEMPCKAIQYAEPIFYAPGFVQSDLCTFLSAKVFGELASF